jgi:hypothetical protein
MRASRDMLNRIEIWQNSVIKITYAISFHLKGVQAWDTVFDRSDFPDFYTIKSLREGDFGVKIRKILKNI